MGWHREEDRDPDVVMIVAPHLTYSCSHRYDNLYDKPHLQRLVLVSGPRPLFREDKEPGFLAFDRGPKLGQQTGPPEAKSMRAVGLEPTT
jgi:hypothetical protein